MLFEAVVCSPVWVPLSENVFPLEGHGQGSFVLLYPLHLAVPTAPDASLVRVWRCLVLSLFPLILLCNVKLLYRCAPCLRRPQDVKDQVCFCSYGAAELLDPSMVIAVNAYGFV